jgi:hypothetical protein
MGLTACDSRLDVGEDLSKDERHPIPDSIRPIREEFHGGTRSGETGKETERQNRKNGVLNRRRRAYIGKRYALR